MRDYAKISPFFWLRGSGKRLRGDLEATVVALYLSSCPNANLVGVYYVPLVSISHETGLSVERVREAMSRVQESGYAFYDFDAEIVWVPNLAKFELGAQLKPGDKRRHKMLAELDKVGDHHFVREFWSAYGEAYGLGPCPFHARSQPPDGASGGYLGCGADPDPDPNPSPTPDPSPSPGTCPMLESGVEMVPEPRVLGPDGEVGAAFSAWRDGIRSVTGKPVSQLSPSERRDVVDMANAHAEGRTGDELMAWITTTAADWARQHDPRFGGFRPTHCRAWLDAGRPARAAPGRSALRQPLGDAAAHPWLRTGGGEL